MVQWHSNGYPYWFRDQSRLTGWLILHGYLHTHALSHIHAHVLYCLRKKYYSEICNIVFSLFNSGQSILLLESSFLEEIERDRIISFLKKSKLQISIIPKIRIKNLLLYFDYKLERKWFIDSYFFLKKR